MKVAELRPEQKKIEITLRIEDKGKAREVASKEGSMHKVCEALAGDETGCIYLSLWDEAIDAVQKGGYYKISNAYTSMYKGSLRIGAGKYGKISGTNGSFNVDTANNMSLKEVF